MSVCGPSGGGGGFNDEPFLEAGTGPDGGPRSDRAGEERRGTVRQEESSCGAFVCRQRGKPSFGALQPESYLHVAIAFVRHINQPVFSAEQHPNPLTMLAEMDCPDDRGLSAG